MFSPVLANLDLDGFSLLDIDESEFRNAAANATAVGRLRRNAANLTWHDGTAAGRLFYAGGTDVPVADGGTGLSSGTSGGVLGYTASGTLASSGALTANALVVGGGAGATPSVLALGTANYIVGMNSGATANEYKQIVQGSNMTITHAAGSVTFAAASSLETGTWSDVTGSRSSGTVYQNTSGRKRRVIARGFGDLAGEQAISALVGSANPPTLEIGKSQIRSNASAGLRHRTQMIFEVPNNWYYSATIDTGTLENWFELDE